MQPTNPSLPPQNFFDHAVNYVLANEGGYNNVPGDSGGETNFGISTAWCKDQGIEVNIRELTKDEAKELYKKFYWDKYNLEALTNVNIATKLMDTMVNIGVIPAVKLAQRVLLVCNGTFLVDGFIGPITLNGLNSLNDEYFKSHYCSYLWHYYHDVVIAHPEDQKFLQGWLVRAAKY